jgi:hypothetical protein
MLTKDYTQSKTCHGLTKSLLIIAISLISIPILAQNKPDCNYGNMPIDSTNFNFILDGLESYLYKTTYQELESILYCLQIIDSTNEKLQCFRAILDTRWILNDTNLIKDYYTCFNTGYFLSEAYYAYATIYLKLFLSQIKDKSDQTNYQFSQKELLDRAEENMWNAINAGKIFSYFEIGQIQEWKIDYLDQQLPEIDFNEDTITLRTYVNDCGEFGGHLEKITFINFADHISAKYLSDSLHCSYNRNNKKSFMNFNGITKTISKKEFLSFMNFVLDYQNNENIISNAPSYIAIIENERVISKTLHGYWPYYLDFRKRLFGF